MRTVQLKVERTDEEYQKIIERSKAKEEVQGDGEER